MKKAILFALVLISSLSISAQKKLSETYRKEVNQINTFIAEENFKAASKLLLKIDSLNPNNANINYNIGLCYLKIPSNRNKAIPFFNKAITNISSSYSGICNDNYAPQDAYYHIAEAYHYNYEFDNAIKYFTKYKAEFSGTDRTLLNNVDRNIQTCYVAKKLKQNPLDIQIQNIGKNINTQYPEYCPIISNDESVLIFTSRRKGSTGGLLDEQGKFYEDIFVSNRNFKGEWLAPLKIGANINTMMHEAAISVSNDGSKLFIYKDDGDDGNIYMSNFEDYQWSTPIALNKNINSEFWETHATLSPDGNTLYFTSNRPGGFGGRDIYKSLKTEKGDWGPAVNMGATINTPFNEDAPFILSDGKTLYFSSEGHESMGGFDVFISNMTDDGFWTTPTNIGYPINTTEDDIFFAPTSDQKHAYYSSAKEEGFGDQDIYVITIVKEKEDFAVIKGTVIDPNTFKPLEAKIEVSDKAKNEVVANTTSDKITGEYAISLPTEKDYAMTIKSDNYQPYTENFKVNKSDKNVEINKDVPLKPLATQAPLKIEDYNIGDKFILRNIYFDTDKNELTKESISELDGLVNFLKAMPTIKIELSGHTDNIGSAEHNKDLSTRRAKAAMDYLISKGIDATRLTSQGYGYEQPIATNSNDEGRKKNRRTEVKIIGK